MHRGWRYQPWARRSPCDLHRSQYSAHTPAWPGFASGALGNALHRGYKKCPKVRVLTLHIDRPTPGRPQAPAGRTTPSPSPGAVRLGPLTQRSPSSWPTRRLTSQQDRRYRAAVVQVRRVLEALNGNSRLAQIIGQGIPPRLRPHSWLRAPDPSDLLALTRVVFDLLAGRRWGLMSRQAFIVQAPRVRAAGTLPLRFRWSTRTASRLGYSSGTYFQGSDWFRAIVPQTALVSFSSSPLLIGQRVPGTLLPPTCVLRDTVSRSPLRRINRSTSRHRYRTEVECVTGQILDACAQ
jgi:hypothetical protein